MPPMQSPADIHDLEDQLDAAEGDAQALVHGLDRTTRRVARQPGSWSVAECFDHLATANRVYLQAMGGAAVSARAAGRLRRGPAAPGFIGRWFVRYAGASGTAAIQEQGAARDSSAPGAPAGRSVRGLHVVTATGPRALRAGCRPGPDRRALPESVRSRCPLSLATGFNVIVAHERRHLWQAWRVRQAAEGKGD